MNTPDFMGLNQFVWWFGVVENRADPLNLGRCQVRCFGWHNEDVNQIPMPDLPWAHPVIPFGASNVHPPKEGTMVFGFFADGKEGRYPVLMGSMPGIPTEAREPQEGFSDPLTDAERATSVTPRRVKSSTQALNAGGVSVNNDTAKRYPENLNQPTVSKLARPDRAEGADGSFAGVRSDSIANTTIDFQRKNRLTKIKGADGYYWNEPFPSYGAKYPFNDVTETESGHAFELDDTPNLERVQLSHRTGSTLEFLPGGDVKLKSFQNKYDVTMGDQYGYVNGIKNETVQGDMFLRINGKLTIQCSGIDLISAGEVNIKGTDVSITATKNFNVFAANDIKLQAGNLMQCRGEAGWTGFGGGKGAALSSSTNALLQGGTAAKISGLSVHVTGAMAYIDAAVTNIFPPVILPVNGPDGADPARKLTNAIPELHPTRSAKKKPKTDSYAFMEQQRANAASTIV